MQYRKVGVCYREASFPWPSRSFHAIHASAVGLPLRRTGGCQAWRHRSSDLRHRRPGPAAGEGGATEWVVVDDRELVGALRAGDEGAFEELVGTYHAAMVRVASFYVGSRAVAEEVAQETWMVVIRGIDKFEGRSSVKTWMFGILTNQARRRGERERRTVPFSSIGVGDEDAEPGLEPERFRPPSDRWAGHWSDPPRPWSDAVGEQLEQAETRAIVFAAIQSLPPNQRDVIALRDVEGWSPEDVSAALGITDGNQRVLLHRARVRIRAILDRHFQGLVLA
jgi:RNA polymerase sigma-70 factor (ECF subfamily)